MQRWLPMLALLIGTAPFTMRLTCKHNVGSTSQADRVTIPISNQENIGLKEKALIAKQFIQKRGLNKRICFLIDMKRMSGKKRFFVYDLDRDSVLESGLVAHGSGATGFSVGPVFSNLPGSYCTALGRYRIAGSYRGRFGRSFSLQGLDASNDQAMNRHIVLHAYSCVPDAEQVLPICNSLGCPMVSISFLKKLEPIINGSPRPLLLWIFN